MTNDTVSTQIKLLRYAGALGALAFAAAIIFVVVVVRSDPETVADLSSDIIDVREWHQPSGKPTLGVFLRYEGADKIYLSRVSSKMMDISEQIIERWPDRYSEIIWFPQMIGIDKNGNQQDVLTVKMHFLMDDLKGINWENMDNLKFMNLAEIDKYGPFGQEVAVTFCSDDYQAKRAQIFCLQVLDRLDRMTN
jgi:hypothetical protein